MNALHPKENASVLANAETDRLKTPGPRRVEEN
jgi:hypothetical protein